MLSLALRRLRSATRFLVAAVLAASTTTTPVLQLSKGDLHARASYLHRGSRLRARRLRGRHVLSCRMSIERAWSLPPCARSALGLIDSNTKAAARRRATAPSPRAPTWFAAGDLPRVEAALGDSTRIVGAGPASLVSDSDADRRPWPRAPSSGARVYDSNRLASMARPVRQRRPRRLRQALWITGPR